jgi:hypothetical protein
LKAEAEKNTVARNEGRLHSQSTRKKKRRRQNILQITYITPPTQTTERSRYIIFIKHTCRLDVLHAGDTNQTTFTQTLLSPNELALASTTTTQLTFISSANEPRNLHTQNHETFNKPSMKSHEEISLGLKCMKPHMKIS